MNDDVDVDGDVEGEGKAAATYDDGKVVVVGSAN